MKNYIIEDIKTGITSGHMTPCGPIPGNVIASVKFRDENGKTKYISMSEVEFYPNFYLTDYDCFDRLMNDDPDEKAYIDRFAGMNLVDYDAYAESVIDKDDNPDIMLIRLVVALVREAEEETNKLAKAAKGKYINEIAIPLSDVEEEYC